MQTNRTVKPQKKLTAAAAKLLGTTAAEIEEASTRALVARWQGMAIKIEAYRQRIDSMTAAMADAKTAVSKLAGGMEVLEDLIEDEVKARAVAEGTPADEDAAEAPADAAVVEAHDDAAAVRAEAEAGMKQAGAAGVAARALGAGMPGAGARPIEAPGVKATTRKSRSKKPSSKKTTKPAAK